MTATVTSIRAGGPSADLRQALETISDSYLRCARTAPAVQHDDYITKLGKRVVDGRVLLAGHELALQFNAFDRGQAQQLVEAPLHAQLAVVRSWYATGPIDLPMLARRETVAQGMADPAEWDLANPTPMMLAAADDALSVHLIELQRLVEGVRRLRYCPESAA